MTYDTTRILDARIPVTVVELFLDTCANTFSIPPCTASGSAGTECYNTFLTCQDTPNYINVSKTYRFYQPVGAQTYQVSSTPFGFLSGAPLSKAKFSRRDLKYLVFINLCLHTAPIEKMCKHSSGII